MTNVLRQLGRLVLSLALGCAAFAHGANQPSAAPDAMLYLNDGDYFSGRLQDCPTSNFLRWQANGTTGPFEFPADAIRSAFFAPPEKRPAPAGEYYIELSDGDVLFGTLTAVTKDVFEFDSQPFGHLKIARSEVRRISSLVSDSFVYRGPDALVEWKSPDISKWRQEAGRLVTDTKGASITKSISIPEQAHFEFEIAWTKAPQFTLAFCAGDKSKQLSEGFKIEVWAKKLVLIRELGTSADVAPIMELDAHADRVHLEALYNHATGEFSVLALDGRELAKITLPKKGGDPLHYVQLINRGAQLSLEQLAVMHWNGQVLSKVDVDKQRLHMKDGSITYGQVTGYDATAKQLVLTSDGKEQRIDIGQVTSIVDAPGNKLVPLISNQSAFRIALHDGSRISGELVKVESEKLFLERPGVDPVLACALPNVRSLVGLSRESKSTPFSSTRTGRWESKGTVSYGTLAAASPNSDPLASCLVWKPRSSKMGSPLRSDVSGRIIYRDPPSSQPQREPEEAQPRAAGGVFWGAVTRALGRPPAPRQAQMARGAGTLCLLTGDRIPCESITINEDGVRFTSSTVTTDFVPHRSVKALEFAPKWTAAALAEVKRTRLLTLPRMQKASPPTHLVASTAGDFFRCRLLSMDADSLAVEARLENKKLPRDRVACIIWLHDQEGDKIPAPTNPPAKTFQVQAIQSDGIRLTFSPKECDGTTLSGKGEFLGDCRVRLNAVDQLILGTTVGEVAAAQYADWKLHDALEPQFAREGADPGKTTNPGADSLLIGKAAPDFRLDMLDGKHFKLSEQKGKVVVLDFWASWCGFCMQSMPDVHKLMAEFKDGNVKYITVNAQEDQATIKSALERLKIEPATVLDIDGAAGEKYQATSLPQIVVIDPDQKIADIIIGAAPDLIDQLRASVKKALEPKKKDK